MNTADIVVVGAGVVGASIACRLAEAGARVVVCERGRIGAQGSTPYSAAQVRLQHSDPDDTRLAALSLPTFEHWAEEIGGDCGFRATGFALLLDAEHRDTAAETIRELAGYDIEAYLLSPEEYGPEQPSVRLDGVAAVAFEPRSGHADPVATTHAFLDRASALGTRVLPGTEVTALLREGERVTGVRTPAGDISAGHVVLATGVWGAGLLSGNGIDLPISTGRIGWSTVNGVPGPGLHVTIDDTLGTYFRPWGEGGVLYRIPINEPDLAPDAPLPELSEETLAAANSLVAQRLPALATARRNGSRSALEAYPADRRPVLGPAGPSGLYLALGLSGGGFKSAPAVGRAVAAELLGGQHRAELAPYRFDRFQPGVAVSPVPRRFRSM